VVGTAAQTAASRGVNGRDCRPLGAAGFACAFEETLPGVSTMFVPVCGATGELTAVLSLTAPSIQLTRERVDEFSRHHCRRRGTQANGLTTSGGVDGIGLHPVGEIHVSQPLDAGGESLPHRVGL
jgi:hypothetical protein